VTLTADPEPLFVLHEYFAKLRLFDLRLDHDGVLKNWAVPKDLPEKSMLEKNTIVFFDSGGAREGALFHENVFSRAK
jgi:hypothetical protein